MSNRDDFLDAMMYQMQQAQAYGDHGYASQLNREIDAFVKQRQAELQMASRPPQITGLSADLIIIDDVYNDDNHRSKLLLLL